jgi:tetratricopeptide (TPR) repeat protein
MEYNSGNFKPANDHIDEAIKVLEKLLPPTHMRLASAKRVKALILEEIAIDNLALFGDQRNHNELSAEAEELHLFALNLSLDVFGEMNLQTAKNYGNLGRLYQTMVRYEDAEKMHLKAIEIKRALLDPYDYEVGLSIGHLASLYNYHLHKYDQAEQLYLQNIAISMSLFGHSYSGLEYDYKGLIHIYHAIRDAENVEKYSNLLDEWHFLRERRRSDKVNSASAEEWRDSPVEEVAKIFLELCCEERH